MTGRRAWKGALALLVAAHAAVGWFPYRLEPPGPRPNGARIHRGTLHLEGASRAVTPDPAVRRLHARSRLTLDLEVAAARAAQHGPSRIFALSRDHLSANLVVGQEGGALVVRFRRPGSEADGSPALVVPGVFDLPGWRTIRLVAGGATLHVAVDGRSRAGLEVPEWQRTWSRAHHATLGNELDVARHWDGRIRQAVLQVDGAASNFLAPGALRVPPRLWFVPERLTADPLGLRSLDAPRAAQIMLARLAASLPVGFVAGRALRRRAGRALLLTSTVLLAGKVLVAGRHPALLDFVLAGGAMAVGLVLSRRWARGAAGPTLVQTT